MSKSQKLLVPQLLFLLIVTFSSGCNRAFYRERADQDVACMIAQKSTDPRWALQNFNINVDPRSRYFDPYDPDASPMPPDDPASHKFMHCVDGKRGWSKWHQFGERPDLENPGWRNGLAEYAPMNENGEVVLTLDSALQIARVNSPSYQDTLEELYLSALDVTTERFRLQTQFFGGTDTTYNHLGRLRGGGESNSLSQDTDFEFRRRFATAGEMVVGIANQFVWQFAGTDSNSALSLLNFSLVQPLLRGAGRDIALETLTIVERALLANLRAYAQFRQGFYTGIAIGDSSVSGPRRRGGFFGGTGLSGFTGQGSGGFGGVGAAGGFGRGGFGGGGAAGGGGGGFAGGGAASVGGFLGLLQTTQEIRNSRTSLNLQLRTLGLLESSLDAGVIDLTQVDQFRQSIETQRATLLQAENGLKDSLESFKITALGLPPDVPIALDDEVIQPFQLIDEDTNKLQDDINDQQLALGEARETDIESVQAMLQDAADLEEDFKAVFTSVDENLVTLEEATAQREVGRSPEEIDAFKRDKDELAEDLDALKNRYAQLSERRMSIEQGGGRETTDQLVIWLRDMLGVAQELSLVQARAKLEAVAVDPIEMDADRAFQIALQNRLDIMNNRASLVDTWRLIQFNADALQSNLDVFIDGNMQTVGDNALKFRAPASTVRAGIRFDAPFTRLVERNNYRQQLIEYQRARRDLIQNYDGIYFGLRSRLRNLEQLRVNLEIQRRATVIAIRRVDLTRETLNEPQPPAQPGQPASTLGPTAAQNLLTALNDLRNTQNNFLSVYLSYYANRMLLARDLGTMQLDEMGRWIDGPLEGFEMGVGAGCMCYGQDSLEEEMPLIPPALPESLQEIIEEGSVEGEASGGEAIGGEDVLHSTELPKYESKLGSVLPTPQESMAQTSSSTSSTATFKELPTSPAIGTRKEISAPYATAEEMEGDETPLKDLLLIEPMEADSSNEPTPAAMQFQDSVEELPPMKSKLEFVPARTNSMDPNLGVGPDRQALLNAGKQLSSATAAVARSMEAKAAKSRARMIEAAHATNPFSKPITEIESEEIESGSPAVATSGRNPRRSSSIAASGRISRTRSSGKPAVRNSTVAKFKPSHMDSRRSFRERVHSIGGATDDRGIRMAARPTHVPSSTSPQRAKTTGKKVPSMRSSSKPSLRHATRTNGISKR